MEAEVTSWYTETHDPQPHEWRLKQATATTAFVVCRWCGLMQEKRKPAYMPTAEAMREAARRSAEVQANPTAHLCRRSPARTLTGDGWTATWDGEFTVVARHKGEGGDTVETMARMWRIRVEHAGRRWSAQMACGPVYAMAKSEHDVAMYAAGLVQMARAVVPVPEPEPEPKVRIYPLLLRGR